MEREDDLSSPVPVYSWSSRLEKEQTSFSSQTALHKGSKHFWHLHSSCGAAGCRHRCLGTDEQQIPQEIPGQEKPKDLMDSALHRRHSMSRVRGRTTPSGSYGNAQDLAGRGHVIFGLRGQNHVVVTHDI